MKLIRYRLHFRSGLVTPLHSDTLMGTLAWAILQHYGEGELSRWIQQCEEQPPFVISNGFPGDLLPKLVMPSPVAAHGMNSKQDMIREVKLNKQRKDRKWLTINEFDAMRSGRSVIWEEAGSPTVSRMEPHVIIDRSTGTSLERNGLFDIEVEYAQVYSLYVRFLDSSYQERFEELLTGVGQIGFGAKKSSGKGVFRLERVDENLAYLDDCEDSNGYAVLSCCVPSRHDSVRGFYKVATKYGKVGENAPGGRHPFKRPLIMVQPGSCFYSPSLPSYFGTVVRNVSPENPKIVQLCFGLTVPVRLPKLDGDQPEEA
ncbi:type III-A CRISPR-associated RAMP protein Csm4 [Paenibacillus elgii]